MKRSLFKSFATILLVIVFSSLTLRSRDRNKLLPPPCTDWEVPYVTGMLETAQHLNFTNKSITRISDGEVNMIVGRSTYYQDAQTNLSQALLHVLNSDVPNLMIGIPNLFSGTIQMNKKNIKWWNQHGEYRKWYLKNARRRYQYFDSLTTSVYIQPQGTNCGLVNQTYEAFRDVWKGKDLIILRGDNGQVYKYDVFDTARSQKILYAPRTQAWKVYERLKDELLTYPNTSLYILLIGPVASVLAYDLTLEGRRALDLGHIAKDYDHFMNSYSSSGFFID